jgi:hypothetical protein
MQNLVFFDKEGHSLNFSYNESLERHEGDLLFPIGSSDTFKTQSLYVFEHIDAFVYENPGYLSLRKWQLFNEYGFHFYQGVATQSITKIEPVNFQQDYYSKWIYGKNIEAIYKLGTFVRFNTPIFEFNEPNIVYPVVGSKKDAILILSNLNNFDFESQFSGLYEDSNYYGGVTIKGVDIFGVYNYITPQLRDTLSIWNEPTFYDRLYEFRKLNIVNTEKNDNYKKTGKYQDVDVVTIKNPDVFDIVHHEFDVSKNSLPTDSTLMIEVISRTDLPRVYKGGLGFESVTSRLTFTNPIPDILKPGTEFKVTNSSLNPDFFKISNIPTFEGNTQLTYYATGSQVIYQNTIYECIQSYTWSAVPIIDPTLQIDTFNNSSYLPRPSGSADSNLYWSSPTYLPIEPSSSSGVITDEFLTSGDLYFTTDRLYFTQSFTQSAEVTLASAAERFKSEMKVLNIDLYYKDTLLKADLIYPSRYAIVNYYYNQVSSTYSIGTEKRVYEKLIETYESLTKEFNYNYSSNWDYNIVFTDIDEFGIIININKNPYKERVAWVYSSGLVDMQRTIDKTLRNWLTRHFLPLNKLGILPSLNTVGYASVYYNSVNLRTDFPNVKVDFTVQVGTTANFYIEHSVVVFNKIGKNLSISINGRTYDELGVTDAQTGEVDVVQTLINWTNSWAETVNDFGIFVSNSASSLKFNVKKQTQRVNLQIRVNLSSLPGIDNYRIIKKFTGNLGALVTSNEIILATASASFEEEGFATGQVIGINKTFYPLQNIQYNSLYLNPDVINLSYEGPFWGLTDSLCTSAPFTTVAFNLGFEQLGCSPSFVPSLLKGMYDKEAFTQSFSVEYIFTNTYLNFTYGGITGMVDITYVEPVNSIYVLGDKITVFNSNYANVIGEIEISGLTQGISLCYNQVSSYLWALSKNALYKIDPYINILIDTYTFSYDAHALSLNNNNGDIYVSFENNYELYVYPVSQNTNQTINVSPYLTYNMVFNDFEGDMYVTTDQAAILRVDGANRSWTSSDVYAIYSATHSIAYDPENEAVYAMEIGTNLKKIDNNSVTDILTVGTSNFDSLLFNNLTSTINISTDTGFSSILVDTDATYFTATPIDFGYQALNQYDGDIYIGADSQIIVLDSLTGQTKNLQQFSGGRITKLIYNPDRRSIWGIQPSNDSVMEVQVQLGSYFTLETFTGSQTSENFYGTLSPDYVDKDYLWLNVREYIRGPRANFNDEPQVTLYWKWFSDNVQQFFLYDFSGNQLADAGVLTYTGPKPLPTVHLNNKPNRDLTKVSSPEYQQTIFSKIENNLDYIDDNEDISIVPEPLQVFIGYNSLDEGPLRSILQLYRRENVDFTIATTAANNDIISFQTLQDPITLEIYGRISLDVNSTSFFTTTSTGSKRGLKPGQHIAIFVKDITNQKKQYISQNNGYLLKVKEVYSREIIVNFFKEVDFLVKERTVVNNFPDVGSITYLSTRIIVWDREIGRFNVLGQTEIEDVRYHTELNNVGKLVSSDDVYIFKEYDIKEEGIDWEYLNMKRKEMLMVKNVIYNYIGSYKSIINAINYFGYNDLELYEYYRNVDANSMNFGKLFKVEIPDIFDNTVEGWTENNFIKHLFPNKNYEETNLFNLTYRITDKQGNNILYYTVEEVQKKLQGLKYWLQKNIIPITHKILDITGRADFVGETVLTHITRDAQIFNVRQNFTPVMFDMNETYLLPVNNGSTVYNCVLDFYILGSPTSSLLPDYYTVDIRTYEIYREWYAFRNYQKGERVVYYNKLYESVIVNNKTNNPRKFENVKPWVEDRVYEVGDIAKYDRLIYVWSGQAGASFSSISPVLDSGVGKNWVDVTEWKEIDLVPVDKISEHRHINNLKPFNFTIDSNITPYLVIEVTSDNGYGAIYRDRKNFEIRGILDIQEIEAFANLTTKQYRDATLPVVYADIDKVPDLTLASNTFTKNFTDLYGKPTNRPYLTTSGDIIYPKIKHGFPYIVQNNSTFPVNKFTIELGDDFIYLQNPYVISNSGVAKIKGVVLNWSGSLPSGATVSLEVRADVALGGKAYWRDPVSSLNNQALVPVTYSVLAKLVTGQNYGMSCSTVGDLNPQYRTLNSSSPIYSSTIPTSVTQSFTSIVQFGGNPQEFVLSTFSQFGINIITASDSVIGLNNFADVTDTFNEAMGSYGYVYYQNRVAPGTWRPRFLVSTYYQDISLTQSYVLRYNNSVLANTWGPNFTSDGTAFALGTNSTSGITTITQSYYP